MQRSQPIGAGSTAESRKAALEAKKAELEQYARTGIHPDELKRKRSIPWADFVTEHLASLGGRRSHSTATAGGNRRKRRNALRDFAEVFGESTPLAGLTVAAVDAYVANLLTKPGKGGRW